MGRMVRVIACFCVLCAAIFAQSSDFHSLHIDKRTGEETGPALVTVNGKARRISDHVYQGWPIMNEQNALLIALEPKNLTGHYRLRYIEGESRKRRDLGAVPFTSAKLTQHQQQDGSWIFVLSGQSEGKSEIVITGINVVRGRIHNASSPRFDNGVMSYHDDATGQTKTAQLTALMGSGMQSIYRTRADGYVQFLPNGTALVTQSNGSFRNGVWSTDGVNMNVVFNDGAHLDLARAGLTPVDGVPAGLRVVVRILQPLSSYKNKAGDKITAALISPAWIHGKIFIPQGSIFSGVITNAHAVGWALRHETAALTVEFTSVTLPDKTTFAIHTRLAQVENAQEKVNGQGTIQGIRSTGTLGYSAEGKIASVAAIDPVAYLFTTVSATSALGFAEPEILYPAGTELELRFESPLITSKVFPATVPPLAPTAADDEKLLRFIHSLPFRTMTQGSNKPSDFTNLAFIGTPQALRNAFLAAGWVPTDALTAASTFRTIRTVSGNQSYNEAPMSVLLLDERPPIFTFTKTTNTFASRHHVRIFDPAKRYQGTTVLTASATQDIGIAFSSKQKTFIHTIDEHIDNERSKIVNDLEFTGCVASAEYVPRSWIPRDAYNSTGDRLQTDGAIVVLQLNSCVSPKRSPSDNAVPPSRTQRIARDTVLTLENDLWRGNLVYQGYNGIKFARNYWIHKDELKPDTGAWQKTDVSGASFKGIGAVPEEQSSDRPGLQSQVPAPDPAVLIAERAHRWDPPRYEIGIEGGYLRYPAERLDANVLLLLPKNNGPGDVYGGIFLDDLNGGWNLGIYFTANTWKWFSNQFSYTYQRGSYALAVLDFQNVGDASDFTPDEVGITTRQFSYNLLFNLRPPKSRWRPYLAVGPALQLISLDDAPLRKAPSYFKVGLQNVGTLVAAFNFAGDPPLEGGGIFQIGLEYGAGIKFRVHPRITLSADFRETWSKNPRFVTDTYTDDYFDSEGLPSQYDVYHLRGAPDAAFRQDRFSGGIAFTF